MGVEKRISSTLALLRTFPTVLLRRCTASTAMDTVRCTASTIEDMTPASTTVPTSTFRTAAAPGEDRTERSDFYGCVTSSLNED